MKTLKNGEYEYRQSDFLGEGSFAKVYKGVIVKTQRVVAVRLLPLKLIKQYGNKIKTIINGEVSVLKELAESPDIDYLFTTRIFDCFLTEHNVTMILEFCPDGNLEDIVSKRGPLGEAEALEIAYQLARGLQFIAKKKVVHRDIKPDNVFIKKEGAYTLYKLGDFGFAVKKQMNEEIVGTPIFMSPELFREEPYGSEVDIWAYGLLVHYMLFKEHYFMENTENKVKKKVLETRYGLSPQQRAKIAPATADLLARCLEFDKAKRLRTEDLAGHAAFASVRERVEALVREVTHRNELTESHLRKETAKGKFMSRVMSYNFVCEVGLYLAKKSNFNLASLYLFKFAFSELSAFKARAKGLENVINHPDWQAFTSSQEFLNSFNIIDRLLAQFSKVFESYYNSIIGPISQQRPDVAQGVTSNLGSGPLAPINPEIPLYELNTNWLARLGSSPEEHFTRTEILVVMELLRGKQVAIDFCALELMKKSATVQQIVQLFEEALKQST